MNLRFALQISEDCPNIRPWCFTLNLIGLIFYSHLQVVLGVVSPLEMYVQNSVWGGLFITTNFGHFLVNTTNCRHKIYVLFQVMMQL